MFAFSLLGFSNCFDDPQCKRMHNNLFSTGSLNKTPGLREIQLCRRLPGYECGRHQGGFLHLGELQAPE